MSNTSVRIAQNWSSPVGSGPGPYPMQMDITRQDTAKPMANAPISYKRSPVLNDPQWAQGYVLKRTFMGPRGRTVYDYLDTVTGESVYLYAPISRTVI